MIVRKRVRKKVRTARRFFLLITAEALCLFALIKGCYTAAGGRLGAWIPAQLCQAFSRLAFPQMAAYSGRQLWVEDTASVMLPVVLAYADADARAAASEGTTYRFASDEEENGTGGADNPVADELNPEEISMGELSMEELAARENAQYGAMLTENAQQSSKEEMTATESGETEGGGEAGEPDTEAASTAAEVQEMSASAKQNTINRKKLTDFDYLKKKLYQVDSTTTVSKELLNVETLLAKDMTVAETTGEEPQILIYHTHSQEGYKDSVAGDPSTTVVGLGEQLAQLLRDSYGYRVLHHTGEYDVGDREHAYSNAAPALEKLLKEHPSIQVVIDLHRDGVGAHTRLVTEIDGKKTAQIMFFNGLSHTTAIGDISWLPNPYIEDNLAFSLQLQLAAADKYPDFARKIYLKGYRYNMHYCPKSLLVEVGAQTNTLEEAQNAMAPLADVLHAVLSGEETQ